MDLDILREKGRITCYIIIAWLVFRFSDILFSGKLGLAFRFNQYAVLFWIEMVILTLAAITLWDSSKLKNARMMFHAHLIAAIGGMMYRFDPTTLAFNPKSGAIYFPTAMEILVALGFVSFAIAVFMVAAKKLAIIPAPLSYWYDYENEVLAKAPEPQLSRAGEALAAAQD
jgi:Ni/Fe-hydrogenase subunit HybB-like protein